MNEAIDAIRVISVGVALNLTPILSLIICAALAVGLWYSIAYIRKAKEKAKTMMHLILLIQVYLFKKN